MDDAVLFADYLQELFICNVNSVLMIRSTLTRRAIQLLGGLLVAFDFVHRISRRFGKFTSMFERSAATQYFIILVCN